MNHEKLNLIDSKTTRGIAVIVLLLMMTTALYARTSTAPMPIVTTTSLLQCAVQDVGGSHVKVTTLVAPGSCPGHFDISPRDLHTLSTSKAVFTHGYEEFVPKIMSSLGSRKPKLVAIKTSGNWMIPTVYIGALKLVTNELCAMDPSHAADYRKSFASQSRKYQALSTVLKARLKKSGVPGNRILCSDQQVEFAMWMGCVVVGTYARAEEFTPALLHQLTKIGRKNHVKLCIDNLQSSPTAGKEIAKDIGAAQVALSNFPGGYSGTSKWSECLTDNVSRVIKGISRK